MSIRRHHGAVAFVRGWLHAVLRRRAGGEFGAEVEAPRPATAPGDAATRIDCQLRLLGAVVEIPEPYRSALFHCRFEGMAPEEVARRLGVPAETMATRLRHALRILGERLEPDSTS